MWASVGAVVMQAGDEGSEEQIQSLAQQVGYSLWGFRQDTFPYFASQLYDRD